MYPGIPTTIKTMGVNITTIVNPKGFNHPNWVNHYFNGGGSLGCMYLPSLAHLVVNQPNGSTAPIFGRRKVHIFRHLSSEQITKLVQSFVLQRYRKGGVKKLIGWVGVLQIWQG